MSVTDLPPLKIRFRQSDGLGRDSYISHNNGGFYLPHSATQV